MNVGSQHRARAAAAALLALYGDMLWETSLGFPIHDEAVTSELWALAKAIMRESGPGS